jgi:hypothetical protein
MKIESSIKHNESMKKLIGLTLLMTSFCAFSQVSEKLLFTMEKNYHAENIMVIHTQTNNDCKFVMSTKNAEKNYLEFYWILGNGKARKEIHSMIRSEIKGRVTFEGLNDVKDSFKVKLNDLKELKHDLADPTLEVTSEIRENKCYVQSVLTLGPSAKYKKIDLKRTYCEVTKNLMGLPNGCSFLQLDGKDIDSGEDVSVRFKKK